MQSKTLLEWAQELISKGWPKEIVPLFASLEKYLDREVDTFEEDEYDDKEWE